MSKPKTTTTTVTTKVATPNAPKQKKSRKRPQKQGVSGAGNPAQQFAKAYACMLEDPFNCKPVRVGMGTLVPTEIGVARINTAILSNASDGALLLVVQPQAERPLIYSAATSAVTPIFAGTTEGAWTNAKSDFSSCRPLALGVRVTALGSLSTAPSRAVICNPAWENEDYTDNATAGKLNLDSLPMTTWFSSHLGTKVILPAGGAKTGTACWKPMSLTNFEFSRDWFAVTQTTVSWFAKRGPAIVMAITGPAALAYDIEVVYLYEGLPNITAVSEGTQPKAGSDYFPSIESLYKSVSPYFTTQNLITLSDMAMKSGIISTPVAIHNKLLNRSITMKAQEEKKSENPSTHQKVCDLEVASQDGTLSREDLAILRHIVHTNSDPSSRVSSSLSGSLGSTSTAPRSATRLHGVEL